MIKYILFLLIAIDQLFNALLGGYPDETLSSRAYDSELRGKILGKFFRPLIDFIFFFEKNHCYISYLAEKEGLQNRKFR